MTEYGANQIEVEEADQPPIQAADNDKKKRDEVECSHGCGPFYNGSLSKRGLGRRSYQLRQARDPSRRPRRMILQSIYAARPHGTDVLNRLQSNHGSRSATKLAYGG